MLRNTKTMTTKWRQTIDVSRNEHSEIETMTFSTKHIQTKNKGKTFKTEKKQLSHRHT